ncbi:MAG: glycosyltransferase family 4 protein [Deltaproteobacteria bacterium]|nr:glycosyltransferase family 4 protein [Deltaproteobacteria bacterium]
MARILLHTLVFAPDGVSTAYLMNDIARQLNRLGHSVTVLTTTPHYNLDESTLRRQPLERVWPGLLYKSRFDGIAVWHVKMPAKGQRTTGRFLDFMRFHAVSLLAGLMVTERFDIVIAPSPPLTIGVISWLMAMRYKAPSVYNVQEIYPDFAINQGMLDSPAMIRLMRGIEQLVYKKSAFIVPISEWFARTIKERGVPREKLVVIPNFVDTELYRPMPRRNAFSEKHGLNDDFVVLYGGNIGLSQDWESLLFAARELDSLPIKFVIVGDGARGQWLKDEISKLAVKNVLLLGYHSREQMPLINASSDIGTIPMKATTTSDTFPSKIYTIMACAKPAIVSADEDSELSHIIHESRCGRVVPPDDPRAYTDAVLSAYEQREALPAEGENGRAYVDRRYSKEAIAEQYDELVRRAVA